MIIIHSILRILENTGTGTLNKKISADDINFGVAESLNSLTSIIVNHKLVISKTKELQWHDVLFSLAQSISMTSIQKRICTST